MFYRFFGRNKAQVSLMDHNNMRNTTIGGFVFPDEIVIHLASYLQVKELNLFAQTNSTFLLLLFNVGKSGRLLDERKKKGSVENLENYDEKEFKIDEDDSFERIQKTIWKSLVVFYFPNFEQSLNIKNWMHVLRRRVAHLKIHNSLLLPIESRKEGDSIFSVKSDDNIAENCEWVYECPISPSEMEHVKNNEKYCNVCKKSVYLVETKEKLRDHISKGHCVAIRENCCVDKRLLIKAYYQ